MSLTSFLKLRYTNVKSKQSNELSTICFCVITLNIALGETAIWPLANVTVLSTFVKFAISGHFI